ncbi:hypothetical protein Tco_0001285 [Tanacetum coccineum]
MYSFNQRGCYGCGGPLDGFLCRRCTYKWCGNNLKDGFCSFCNSRAGNSFIYDSNPNSFDNPPDFSYHPPQPQYETYSCELCGNDAHYGYNCPPQVPFVYNQDPCFNQNFDYFPQTSPSFPQQYPCCEDCGGPHETFQCQPMNYYKPNPFYDSNYSGFDQIEPLQFPVIHQPPQQKSMEALQAREDLMKLIENFLKKFNRISFWETPKVLMHAWDKFLEIKHAQSEEVQELLNKLLQDLRSINEELAEYINTPNWNLPTSSYDDDDDDDDEESSIPLKDIIISGLPPCVAITPALSPKEPVDSLIMKDEHLYTIPETESDEFIKSSVKNLVQTPSEFEDVSDGEWNVPDCDDSQTTIFSTYSNPLFDDSTSIDDQSSHEEEIHEMSFITYSNPLFDLDEEINSSEFNPIHNEDPDSTLKNDRFDTESYLLESLINRDTFMTFSPKIDFLLEEFADELALLKTSSPGINEADYDPDEEICRVERLLYDNSSPCPLKELNVENSIESFPPSHIPVEDSDPFMEEIDLFLAYDESIPPGIDSDYSDSEGENPFLERLLHDDPTPLLDIPSPTHVTFPFEDHHDLDFTCVVRVFLPFFTYPVTSSFLLSSGSEDTIFDPGISTFHFSSLKPVAYENPIVIFLFFCFCPKDKGIRGESS